MAEKKTMEQLTEAMMEHCCDKLCKYPHEVEDQDELDDICCECEMEEFVDEILRMCK